MVRAIMMLAFAVAAYLVATMDDADDPLEDIFRL